MKSIAKVVLSRVDDPNKFVKITYGSLMYLPTTVGLCDATFFDEGDERIQSYLDKFAGRLVAEPVKIELINRR